MTEANLSEVSQQTNNQGGPWTNSRSTFLPRNSAHFRGQMLMFPSQKDRKIILLFATIQIETYKHYKNILLSLTKQRTWSFLVILSHSQSLVYVSQSIICLHLPIYIANLRQPAKNEELLAGFRRYQMRLLLKSQHIIKDSTNHPRLTQVCPNTIKCNHRKHPKIP